MKKHFYYAMAFLLFLTVSCVSEKIESEEDRVSYNAQAVWEYNGENTTLTKVIQELKNSPNREKLERRLLKNEVLWKDSKFLLIGNKKRIMVPFLSLDKENVIGVLALVKDSEGKTTFDMVVRKDLMSKSAILPFWKRGVWAGYFLALDKDILGIKNGSPGFAEKLMNKNSKVKNINSKTMGTECGEVKVGTLTIRYYECEYELGEANPFNCMTTGEEEFDLYDWRCWDVPDEPIDEPSKDDPPTCPDGFVMNANGECVPENQCGNAENEFDSSFGQSMAEDISENVTYEDGNSRSNSSSKINSISRTVTYTRQIYAGYGMKLYSKDKGVHVKMGNNWEWSSIEHEFVYPEIDNSIFEVTHRVNSVTAILKNPNTARITINYNVKIVFECNGIRVKDKDENHTSLSVKSPYVYGDQ